MEEKKFPKEDGNSISLRKKIVTAVIVVISIVLLLVITQISLFVGLFSWFVIKIRVISGLDVLPSQAIAFIAMALLLGTPLGNFVWSFFPIPQKDRKMKRFVSLSLMSLVCFVSVFVSKNVYFNPSNGQPIKYYVVNFNNKYEFYDAPGYDTKSGKKLKPVIKEVVDGYLNGESAIDYPEAVPFSFTDLIFENNLKEKKMVLNKPFHSVTFENKLNESVCVLVGHANGRNSETIVCKIHSKKTAKLDLEEGKYIFACVGEDAWVYDMEYDSGYALKSTRGKNNFLPLPYINACNRKDSLRITFFLTINNSDKQLVRIRPDAIFYYKDKDDANIGWVGWFIIVWWISSVIYVLSDYYPSKKK